MRWPPYSPDILPIENIWGALKNALKFTVELEQDKIEEEIVRICQVDKIDQMCKTLIETMPRRVKAVIASKGGPIKY